MCASGPEWSAFIGCGLGVDRCPWYGDVLGSIPWLAVRLSLASLGAYRRRWRQTPGGAGSGSPCPSLVPRPASWDAVCARSRPGAENLTVLGPVLVPVAGAEPNFPGCFLVPGPIPRASVSGGAPVGAGSSFPCPYLVPGPVCRSGIRCPVEFSGLSRRCWLGRGSGLGGAKKCWL